MHIGLKELVKELPPGVLTISTRTGLKRVQHLRKVDITIAFFQNYFDGKATKDHDILKRPLFLGLQTANGIHYFWRKLDCDMIRSDAGVAIPATHWNALRMWNWLTTTGADKERVIRALGKTENELEQAIISACAAQNTNQ